MWISVTLLTYPDEHREVLEVKDSVQLQRHRMAIVTDRNLSCSGYFSRECHFLLQFIFTSNSYNNITRNINSNDITIVSEEMSRVWIFPLITVSIFCKYEFLSMFEVRIITSNCCVKHSTNLGRTVLFCALTLSFICVQLNCRIQILQKCRL